MLCKCIFRFVICSLVFSAPEPKAHWQVHYCTLSAVLLSSLTFHIFDFSSETAECNSTKLDRKQDLNFLYQVCVFLGWSVKQDGRSSLWLAETFFTSPLKPLIRIQWILTGSKADQKNKMVPLANPSKRWHIVLRCTQVHNMWPYRPLVSLALELGTKIVQDKNSDKT